MKCIILYSTAAGILDNVNTGTKRNKFYGKRITTRKRKFFR